MVVGRINDVILKQLAAPWCVGPLCHACAVIVYFNCATYVQRGHARIHGRLYICIQMDGLSNFCRVYVARFACSKGYGGRVNQMRERRENKTNVDLLRDFRWSAGVKTSKASLARGCRKLTCRTCQYRQCLSAVPADFRGFLTSDKFCAGRLNGESICAHK